MTTRIEEALAFTPPDKAQLARYFSLINRYFDPQYCGFENIARDEPTLFVGNHSRFGFLDMPVMVQGIYEETGIYPRGLSDRFHYTVPVWRDYITRLGGVVGSRDMCRAMMEAGKSLLVFPGGGGEVVKGKEHNYTLLWKQRLGFVRMAIQNGYTITPFSAVGADNAYDPIIDGHQLLSAPLIGRALEKIGLHEHLPDGKFPPIPRGIGLSMIPRPEKFYFSFGKPIRTEDYKGQEGDENTLRKLRKRTANCINEMTKSSLLLREQEQYKQSTLRRLLRKL